jgi:hypothetical protein
MWQPLNIYIALAFLRRKENPPSDMINNIKLQILIHLLQGIYETFIGVATFFITNLTLSTLTCAFIQLQSTEIHLNLFSKLLHHNSKTK